MKPSVFRFTFGIHWGVGRLGRVRKLQIAASQIFRRSGRTSTPGMFAATAAFGSELYGSVLVSRCAAALFPCAFQQHFLRELRCGHRFRVLASRPPRNFGQRLWLSCSALAIQFAPMRLRRAAAFGGSLSETTPPEKLFGSLEVACRCVSPAGEASAPLGWRPVPQSMRQTRARASVGFLVHQIPGATRPPIASMEGAGSQLQGLVRIRALRSAKLTFSTVRAFLLDVLTGAAVGESVPAKRLGVRFAARSRSPS
jgi:hypothetical protein